MRYYANGQATEDLLSGFSMEELTSGSVQFEGDGILSDIDALLSQVYDRFAVKIFGGLNSYRASISLSNLWVGSYGIDSDCGADSNELQRLIRMHCSAQDHRLLYFYDCYALISSVQNRIIDTKNLFVGFYRALGKLEYIGRINPQETVYWMAGEETIFVCSLFENFLIKLYSVFDLLTKLVYEYKNIPANYSEWPRLKSKQVLFWKGNYPRQDNDMKSTIFSSNPEIRMVVSLRHELIHQGTLEYQNKVYFVFENGLLREKYLLIPDLSDGIIATVVNRKRFFSQKNKINMLLPNIYLRILAAIKGTIENAFEVGPTSSN